MECFYCYRNEGQRGSFFRAGIIEDSAAIARAKNIYEMSVNVKDDIQLKNIK
jgi:hypothetical protein